MPECQNIKKGALDQYGSEHFEVKPFDTTRLERVKTVILRSVFRPYVLGVRAESLRIKMFFLLNTILCRWNSSANLTSFPP